MSTSEVEITKFAFPVKNEKPKDWKVVVAKYLYHWPLFLIGLILSIGGVLAYLRFAKPVYEIKATLVINDQKKIPDQQSALKEIDFASSSKIIENEIEVLKSKQLISQVVDELQLWIVYQKKEKVKLTDLYKNTPVKLVPLKVSGNAQKEIVLTIKDNNSFLLKLSDGRQKVFKFNDVIKDDYGTWKLETTQNLRGQIGSTIHISVFDPEAIALQYQKVIDVTLLNKLATTVVLTLVDPVAQRGKDILNQIILDYNVAGRQSKERETKKTLDFLDQRLADVSADLAASEKGIEGFKSTRGITDLSAESEMNLQNLQTNDAKLNEVNTQLSVVEGVDRYLNSSLNSNKAPATLGLTDPALSTMIEKLSLLQLQRDRLLAVSPETNPDFEPINRQIASTKAAIRESVKNIKSSLINTKRQLESYNSGFQSTQRNIPTQERQYTNIKRQQAAKEELYKYLLQKKEEASVSYASTLSDDKVVDQAYAGPVKTPPKGIALGAGVLLGLLLPIGFIFARQKLDSSIVDIEEIKAALEIPIIIEIPYEKAHPLISTSSNTNATSEQFRSLRTKLSYLFKDKDQGRVTLITSSTPGEGKSFVSSNIAVSLAHVSRKVVVLELDLRKPEISKIFDLPAEHLGITDYLTDKAGITEIVQSSASGIHVISSGTFVENPSELLENKQLENLISVLKGMYDDIIIDSPPVHLVPDAMIFSRLADVTLYIIKQGLTEKNELGFIKDLNNDNLLNNLHIVFNGIQRAKFGYGYKYNTNYYQHDKKRVGSTSIFSDFANRF